MPTNCSICGGLIKLTTREYAEQDAPALFQLVTTCEDCGRSSTYDCVKPSPEKFVVDPKDGERLAFPLREREPDEALYRKAVRRIHDRKKMDQAQAQRNAEMDTSHLEPQDYINRVRSEEFHMRTAEREPDNVIPFTGVTRHDVPVDTIMAHLLGLNIMEIVAVGFLQDGSEFFSSSKSDGAAALWHLSRAQHKLMTYADLDEGE